MASSHFSRLEPFFWQSVELACQEIEDTSNPLSGVRKGNTQVRTRGRVVFWAR